MPGIYVFISDVELLSFSNPTFHVEAIESIHVSLSLLIVALVRQHVPLAVAVLPPHHTQLLSPTLPYFILLASECLGPGSNFCAHYQLVILASKLSLLEISSDFPGFAQLNSWFSFILTLCCWHRQLSLQMSKVLENSTLGK